MQNRHTHGHARRNLIKNQTGFCVGQARGDFHSTVDRTGVQNARVGRGMFKMSEVKAVASGIFVQAGKQPGGLAFLLQAQADDGVHAFAGGVQVVEDFNRLQVI